jgi:hypothetical protein
MSLLLPYRFKKIGNVLAPLGLLMWILVQLDVFKALFIHLFGRGQDSDPTPPYIVAAVVTICLSFFSFLAGIYFMIFSKERVEDEMIQKVRSESFQFAAFTQLVFVIIGFVLLFFIELKKEVNEDMFLEAFFGLCILIFWLSFIGRQRYILRGLRR